MEWHWPCLGTRVRLLLHVNNAYSNVHLGIIRFFFFKSKISLFAFICTQFYPLQNMPWCQWTLTRYHTLVNYIKFYKRRSSLKYTIHVIISRISKAIAIFSAVTFYCVVILTATVADSHCGWNYFNFRAWIPSLDDTKTLNRVDHVFNKIVMLCLI